MLEADRIRSKGLKVLVTKGDRSKIRPEWIGKVERILAALNVAVSPEELNMPGMRWHQLKGDRQGTYSVLVSKNWRITFRWDHHGPFDVDLEDYHGD